MNILGIAVLLAFGVPVLAAEPQGCSALVENFCKDLWSDRNQGNMKLGTGPGVIDIKVGETSLDYDDGFERYLHAILKARKRLPADFARTLEREGYFTRLKKDLGRDPSELKRPELIVRVRDERSRRNLAWQRAFDRTHDARMEKKHAGFLRQQRFGLPEEWRLAAIRVRDEFRAEIYRAIWLKSPDWRNLVQEAEAIRAEYIRFVRERLSVSAETRNEWIRRLQAVKFQAPGTVPERAERESSCASGARNAFYHGVDHTITICSGYFNRWDLLQSVPHELTHALGLSPGLGDPLEPDPLTRSFSSILERTCSEKKPSCEEWRDWKKAFSGISVEPPSSAGLIGNFQSCINGGPVQKSPSPEKLAQMALDQATDAVEYEAGQNGFLFMIAPDRGDLNGKRWKNLSYMNPCGLWPWPVQPPLQSWNTLKTFFVNEYRCSRETDRALRMRGALEESKRIVQEVNRKGLAYEGRYSANKRMQAEGFSKDIEERLADRLGREVGAFMLERYPELEKRRDLFLAGIASFCDPPSLRKDFPTEFQVQKNFYFDGHAESEQRRREALIEPIRKTLGCSNDVGLKECTL